MKKHNSTYIAALQILLEANANPTDAAFMKKYMRNQFDYFGIKAPRRKELFRMFIKENGWPSIAEMDTICRDLYSNQERELQYFAMEMADRNIKKFNESAIELFEYMIVTHAWWDTVDYMAANILGRFFRLHPEIVIKVTSKWMDSGNIWLQRSCILFQLKYKKNTDTDLLYSFIRKLNSSDEFFIQKAIGWILREYSKVNPDEVCRFTSGTTLKPLSRREALRIINKKKLCL
jgi:3-methyladenine DNA glycosylase AlkD